jgi:heme-degrading monooxygenase HmoA
MMTIVTHVKLKEGAAPEWDEAMRERLEAARDQPGWVGGELAMPLDNLNGRVIIGTWETRGVARRPDVRRDPQAAGRARRRSAAALVARGDPGRPGEIGPDAAHRPGRRAGSAVLGHVRVTSIGSPEHHTEQPGVTTPQRAGAPTWGSARAKRTMTGR